MFLKQFLFFTFFYINLYIVENMNIRNEKPNITTTKSSNNTLYSYNENNTQPTLFNNVINNNETTRAFNDNTTVEETIERGTIYFLENKNVFFRALLIIICVAILAMLYLFIRCMRQKNENSYKNRRLPNDPHEFMELKPLSKELQEEEEEDDENTLFEAPTDSPRKKNHQQISLLVKEKSP